jgi:hypothetical protein
LSQNKLVSQEWVGKPGDEIVPDEYRGLYKHQIVILSTKKEREFLCGSYALEGPFATFTNVLIDNSKRNARGQVIELRIAFYDQVVLANTGFMARPIMVEVEDP